MKLVVREYRLSLLRNHKVQLLEVAPAGPETGVPYPLDYYLDNVLEAGARTPQSL